MKLTIFLAAACTLFSTVLFSQVIVIDPGHGYGPNGENYDSRTWNEISTNCEVGLKLRTLLENEGYTVYMTRTHSGNGSWVSVNQRATMADNWGADRLLSIHCNGGGGTGTESFWCNVNTYGLDLDISWAQKVQAKMVYHGSWFNRRCVEDDSYLPYHLGVLSGYATSCLNEIGFVDYASDLAKLLDDGWRDNFALGYLNAILEHKPILNLTSPTASASGVSIPVGFSWAAMPNANAYRINVATSTAGFDPTATPMFPNALVNESGTGSFTSYSWSGASASTTYYWVVRGNVPGIGSVVSEIRNFSTAGSAVNPCSNITSIGGCGSSYAKTYTGGGSGAWFTSTTNPCGTTSPGIEKIYSFVAPTTGTYSIQVTAASGYVDYLWKSSSCSSSGWTCIGEINAAGQYGTMSFTAGTTYYFLLDDRNSTTGTHTFYINCPVTNYTISTSSVPSAGGTTVGGGTFTSGQSCTVTASANSGYTFTNWTENGSPVSNLSSYPFTVTTNRTLVANFTQQTGTCTTCPAYDFNILPTTGWLTSSSSILSYGCKIYRFPVAVGLIYTFKTGCGDGATADFDTQLELYDNNGCNLITSDDDACGVQSKIDWTCNYTAAGFVFLKVKGYNANFGNYTLAINKIVPAVTYTITTSSMPPSGGTTSGGGTYTDGETCTVTASANTDYSFTSWTENGTQVYISSTYPFMVTANRSLVANFTCNLPLAVGISGGGTSCNSATLTASNGSGGTIYWQGTVSNGTSMTTPSTSQTVYSSGTYYFRAYNSCGWGIQGSTTVTINTAPSQPAAISGPTSVISGNTYSYSTAGATGAASYTWTYSGGGTPTGTGTTISLTPTSSGTLSVTGSNTCGNSSPRTLSITVSTPINYSISTSSSPAAGGSTGGGGTFSAGQTCTVTASANSGYSFLNWTENGIPVWTTASYSFTVSGNRNLSANFTLNGQTVNLNYGLVAYYPFNGSANDMSGNSNHGTVNGATLTTDRFCNANSAYNFAGISNPQTIMVPSSNSLQFTDAASFSVWVCMNSYQGIDGWGSNTPYGYHIIFAKDFDQCCLTGGVAGMANGEMTANGGTGSGGIGTGDTVPRSSVNQWVNLTYVITSTNLSIYANGVLVTSKNGATSFANSNTKNLWLGRLSSFWYPFNGKMDDLRIYNRALNVSEIQAIYNLNSAVTVVPYFKKKSVNSNYFLHFIDYNNDGKTDMLSRESPSGRIYFYLNTGTTFVVQDTLNANAYSMAANPSSKFYSNRDQFYSDIDNDGNKDLVIYSANHASCSNNSVRIYWGNPAFPWFSDVSYTELTITSGFCVGAYAVDIDNDGLKDIFIRSASGVNTMNKNYGGRVFAPVTTFNTGRDIGANFIDYDGDGFKDLCYTKNGWADGQWGFRFNKGLGNGNFSASTITSYATQRPYDDFVKLHANPMVNSIPDVLFNCSNDGTNGGNFYIGEWNQSLGNFNFYTLPTGTNSETMLLQSIDYNNDGMADIIMRYRTGTNPYYYTTVAYLNNGYGGFGSTDTIMKNTPYYPHQMFKDNWELKLSAYGNSDTLYVFSIFPNLPATIPAPAGAISGNSTVCPGQTAVIYSISPIAHATSYIWTLPPGATGTSTTNSIAVNYSNSAVSGTITVQGSNTCSRGATATVQVSVAPCTVVVENQTLGSGQTQCISAVQTVTIGGNGGTFLINPGGSSTMIAGLNVKYLPNTKVKSGGYMLGYITTNGQYCTQISNPVVNSPVSFLPAALDVPEISADQVFRVYPNPTGGEFTVECLGNTPDFLTHITVFSMSGKQVFDNALVHVKTHVCSISTLPPGLYFIHLRSENQTKVLKILKI